MYSFSAGNDGALPYAALALGSDGATRRADLTIGSDLSLYGTTSAGGANGVGSVFKITPH